MRAADALAIPAAGGLILSGAGVLWGMTGFESGGAATRNVVLRDGSATGKIVGAAAWGAGVRGTFPTTQNGVRFRRGLFAVMAGAGVLDGCALATLEGRLGDPPEGEFPGEWPQSEPVASNHAAHDFD